MEEPKSKDWAPQVEEEFKESKDWTLENRKLKKKELISQVTIMKGLEEDADKNMEMEVSERKKVLDLLGQGMKFHDNMYKEAVIVATAYRVIPYKSTEKNMTIF